MLGLPKIRKETMNIFIIFPISTPENQNSRLMFGGSVYFSFLIFPRQNKSQFPVPKHNYRNSIFRLFLLLFLLLKINHGDSNIVNR
jgi:hypothetical protein